MGPQPLEPPSSQTNSDQSGSIFHFAIHLSDRAKLHHTLELFECSRISVHRGLHAWWKAGLTLLKGKHLKTATRFRMIAFDSVNRHELTAADRLGPPIIVAVVVVVVARVWW